uniref:Uncharacterized protein n=1 Tax=Salix viminalis TaxID=40686 RepID=A0A6N2N1Y9_SALVM
MSLGCTAEAWKNILRWLYLERLVLERALPSLNASPWRLQQIQNHYCHATPSKKKKKKERERERERER